MKLKDKEALKQRLVQRTETKEQQRDRIATVLAAEVSDMQKSGIPNEVLGLKVYDSLIDARVSVENLYTMVTRLALQLGIEVEAIANDAKTLKSC